MVDVSMKDIFKNIKRNKFTSTKNNTIDVQDKPFALEGQPLMGALNMTKT